MCMNCRNKIICVSDSIGREVWTGLLDDLDKELEAGLLSGGPCEMCDGSDPECMQCGGAGTNPDPLYMASLYEGTEADLEAALDSRSHSSHYLSAHCEELFLGDFI